MTQKVIKIGSSAGVTIPKATMKDLDLKVGDEVKVSIEPVKKQPKLEEYSKNLDVFMDTYSQDLRDLADR